MPLYVVKDSALDSIDSSSFSRLGMRERNDLQRLLCTSISAIDPGLLVIAEEFGSWADSRRRIDLLAIDRAANLVVIELKRDEDGGHMELQALRYAAMISTMTFAHVVEAFSHFLEQRGEDASSAEQRLLGFLDWDEAREDQFGQDVRIVLVAADFSREITTTVLFLNDRGLDIRCVRLKPYSNAGQILLDIQQIIPLPEASEYTVSLRQKRIKENASRTDGRDFTKYDVFAGEQVWRQLPKRRAILQVIQSLRLAGASMAGVQEGLGKRSGALLSFDGVLDGESFKAAYVLRCESQGKKVEAFRWFVDDSELLHDGDKTYSLTKMWGSDTGDVINALLRRFPNSEVRCVPSEVVE